MEFEEGLFTGMILIDIQKVSDTIDHQILIKKMKYLGFSKKCNCLVSERKFKINISNSYSSPSSMICNVPQGSILGPLLVLLYNK